MITFHANTPPFKLNTPELSKPIPKPFLINFFLGECTGTRTCNRLVRKQTLSHLAKLIFFNSTAPIN